MNYQRDQVAAIKDKQQEKDKNEEGELLQVKKKNVQLEGNLAFFWKIFYLFSFILHACLCHNEEQVHPFVCFKKSECRVLKVTAHLNDVILGDPGADSGGGGNLTGRKKNRRIKSGTRT